MFSSIREISKDKFTLNNKTYHFFNLEALSNRFGSINKLPKSIKILLENLLRNQNKLPIQEQHFQYIIHWIDNIYENHEIFYYPSRVLMQDFTGIPVIVDLAAMREAVKKIGGNIEKINPVKKVDLVIDHSITVDSYKQKDSYIKNNQLEMTRNLERYAFLKWGEQAFKNIHIVPPENGICHQINLEYLAKVIQSEKDENDENIVFPDTLIGTDSHTTMINGLGVLGWGVGGIEAIATILGQPISIPIPNVIGLKLVGKLQEGVTATDLVLSITQILRKHNIVGQFIEFYGNGLDSISLSDRATISNMAPEYGATCSFFPVDEITIDYLRLTGRSEEQISLVEYYCKKQGLWRESEENHPNFIQTIEIDMHNIVKSLSGPYRPQDKVELSIVPKVFKKKFEKSNNLHSDNLISLSSNLSKEKNNQLSHGSIVIAAITSCTNTSNIDNLITAGLLARNAVNKGLRSKPWIKTSFAPGSKVVTRYLIKTNLMTYLDHLGFNLVGYGCTTCIGNSGPLDPEIENIIRSNNLTVNAILSGNRNFSGRIHPLVKANWLASPPLVIVYALVGNILVNITREPIGYDLASNPVYLYDIWPSSKEIKETIISSIRCTIFLEEYKLIYHGNDIWKNIESNCSSMYHWNPKSTYIRMPPFFNEISPKIDIKRNIRNARILAIFGDSVTTDHISPAGSISITSPAGKYLKKLGIKKEDFNSYGSRRGNHEIMIRGTFSNIRIRNEMLKNIEGGYTYHVPSGRTLSIYEAAIRYLSDKIPLVIIAGKEYGSGSSRDWAAKGPKLLGIQVILAESFERIHRSNLIGMGILPLEFPKGINRKTLQLTGHEIINISNLEKINPKCEVPISIVYPKGTIFNFKVKCRIDTNMELIYYKHDGILQYIIRKIIND